MEKIFISIEYNNQLQAPLDKVVMRRLHQPPDLAVQLLHSQVDALQQRGEEPHRGIPAEGRGDGRVSQGQPGGENQQHYLHNNMHCQFVCL